MCPIIAGDRVHRASSRSKASERDTSTPTSDERLLTTIASNLGVALENARLFDETKRLLGEDDQPNAELAIVNEIRSALAKKLDYESIIDLVGDQIQPCSRLPGPEHRDL